MVSQPSNLFARYHRLMRTSFAAVLVMALGVMAVEVYNEFENQLRREAARISADAHALSVLLNGSRKQVEAFRVAGETWFALHPGPPLQNDVLFQTLMRSTARDGVLSLDDPPFPFNRQTLGNMTTMVRDLDPVFEREADMAFGLTPVFQTADHSVPDASWFFYLSASEFIYLFPWVPSTEFAFRKSLYDRGYYKNVGPLENPGRSAVWSEPYLDSAGAGLTVTISAPVYDGDRFTGVVGMDLALVQLNRFVKFWRSDYGDLFIVNDRNELIAHSDLIRATDTAIKPVSVAFPEPLRERSDEILKAAAGEGMANYGAWRIDAEPVRDTPFRLVLVVSEWAVLAQALTASTMAVAALLFGLGAMLVLTTLSVRREFIRPSERLVSYIADESHGRAVGIPDVPPAWRPWFETIQKVFNEHAQLVSIRQELDIARRMQQAILPAHFPDRPDLQLFARMTPAKEVGGDFYDFFWLDERRLGIVVADVSGKGVPAALFMAVSRTLLRATAPAHASPGATLAAANDLLAQDNEQAMFVTVFYGILDLDAGRLVYASGGHNPPVLVLPDGGVSALPQVQGMALGVVEGVPFADGEVVLPPGAALVCYTDGITEAFDAGDTLFTEQRLVATLEEEGAVGTAEALVGRIFAAVDEFAKGVPQADDITCLVTRWDGPPRGAGSG